MTVTELNEDTKDKICDLLKIYRKYRNLKIKICVFCLIKKLKKYGGNVVNKLNAY